MTPRQNDSKNWGIASHEKGKYIRSSIGNSVFTCDETIEETKTVPPENTSTKIVLTKWILTNFYLLLAFLLITIALLVAVSIYCYLIKYEVKQKPLLPLNY